MSAGLLIAHAASYLPFLSDDALISLRYAQRLLGGHGLTWTDGPAVEGYSNLLWVLSVSAIGAFGADLIAAARGLGLAGVTATLVAIWCVYARPADGPASWFATTVGGLFLALSAPLAVWAVGGLEQPLVAALVAASCPLAFSLADREREMFRTAWWLSFVLGLLCLTRPDGPIFAVAGAAAVLCGGWLAARPRPVAHAAVVLFLPLALTAGQLIFRLLYYGEVVPNTALVKISGSASHWALGVEYVQSAFRALRPFSALALATLAALLVVRQTRERAVYLGATAIAWTSYVAVIGGDIFPAYRHAVPLIVLCAFVLAEGARLAAVRWHARPGVFYPMVIAVLLAFVPYVYGQSTDKWVQRARTERWEWQGKEVALTLKQAFGLAQPLIAVTAAGALPYWSELPSLDMMGLSDHYLPRHRPATFGTGMVGHELGDGAYVLSRKPDVIIFDVGSPQPSWRSGEELNRLPEFHERYVPVVVQTRPSEYTAVLFVNKYSDRIGIVRSGTVLTVPGFLFTGPEIFAALNQDGRLVTSLSGPRSARLVIEVDERLQWAIDGAASGLLGVRTSLRQDGRSVSVVLSTDGLANVEVRQVVLRGTLPEPERKTGAVNPYGRRGVAQHPAGDGGVAEIRTPFERPGGRGSKQWIAARKR
jgi:hypothetical protein